MTRVSLNKIIEMKQTSNNEKAYNYTPALIYAPQRTANCFIKVEYLFGIDLVIANPRVAATDAING